MSFAWCGCADTLGGGRWPVLRFDPISLVLAQRNGVEPPKKSAFLPRRLHHPRERCCLGRRDSSSPDLGEGPWRLSGDCACAPFLWAKVADSYCPFHPISLLLRKETGWSPKETRLRVPPRGLLGPAASPTDSKPQHHSRLRQADLSARSTTKPSPSRAKMSNDHRGRSAHADGGDTGVKKALFFGGSTPFLWASTKEMGSKGRAGPRPPPKVTAHTHKPKEQRKGGTPGEGSPLDPLLRFMKHKESSALKRSAARDAVPGPCHL